MFVILCVFSFFVFVFIVALFADDLDEIDSLMEVFVRDFVCVFVLSLFFLGFQASI